MANCSSNATALWPVTDQLHLWTLATARSWAMLRHFLAHYARHGVQGRNAHVVVHEDFAPESTLQRVRRILTAAGVTDVTYQHSVNSSDLENLKLEHLNSFIRERLPQDGWLIFADVDEHFAYPCDVLQQLRQKRREAACAFMQDRVAADLRALPPVHAHTPLERQYPACAKLRGMMRTPVTGNPMKIALMRARPFGQVPMYHTAHTVKVVKGRGVTSIGGHPSGGGNGCVLLPRFAHYTMTRGGVHEAVELSRRKVEDGYKYAPTTYHQMMKMVRRLPCKPAAGGEAAAAPSGGACYELKSEVGQQLVMPCGETCGCMSNVTPSERM